MAILGTMNDGGTIGNILSNDSNYKLFLCGVSVEGLF